ncbi:iron-sulfur cluster insertion protein ErpA [Oceanibaculum pacificum]|uniref:Heme biosynthesis protein HemY n=1 Tax=Oceanibaculum pacificum TaxID=580166 RepID=A0A154WGI0_9PROT|nr:iron-sulfur cluster insertion protein ErpA [Oceanibaculum pacificum]KZD12633.1 heme biosynthesis protein HemY [Oceanibaculum pacificum]
MAEATVLEQPRAVSLSESAARQVSRMLEKEPEGGALMLRLSVTGGGCSGFQYNFAFDDEVHSDDSVFERDGVKLVVDETSLDLLAGAEVDYVEELIGASFQVKNPNAASSCGCGTSFAL